MTLLLFLRMGVLLVIAFMLTRVPSFRYLLEREQDIKAVFVHSIIFGIFAIAATHAGVVLDGEQIIWQWWIPFLQPGQFLVGSTLVAVVIAGLMGGLFVGLGSGLIAVVYLFFLGGQWQVANGLVNPIAGVLAGFTARFFSQERVIAPAKALFLGMFGPILHMALFALFKTRIKF